jgi:hypothetical protein
VDNAEVDAEYFKRHLGVHEELVHITVELNNHRETNNLQAECASA